MARDIEPVEMWCEGEEWCPITTTATLIARKWHPVIIHRLLEDGPLGFNDLKAEVDGVSSKVLSESLEDLESKRLLTRTIVSEKPVRVEYSLTEMGTSMEPVITAMAEWGTEYLVPAEDRDTSLA